MRAVWLSIAFFLATIVPPALADQAAPRPLLFLWESGGLSSWPGALRFVVYDDGQTLYSPDPEETLRDKTPVYYATKMSPADALAMATDALKQIVGTEHEIRGDDSWTDRGWTVIQIWNAKDREYDRYDAYGHPCLAEGRTFDKTAKANIGTWAMQNRQGTDQRFLALCDTLSRYRIQPVEPWRPKTMWVSLIQGRVKPDTIFSWPSDWPPMPLASDIADHVKICVSLVGPISITTANLASSNRGTRQLMFDAGAQADDRRWWVINSWGFSLPGEIDLDGAAPGPPSLAEGSCVPH